jgi:hypothetical protein
MYLSPSLSGGSPYCLDPESDALRASLENLRVTDRSELSRAALADDLDFFAGLLAKVYSGHPELSQRYDLQLDAFFAEWARPLREAPGAVSFAEGVVAGFIRLARYHRDRHLAPIGGDMQLHERPALRVSEFLGPAPAGDVDLAQCDIIGELEGELAENYQVLSWTLRRTQRVGAAGGIEPAVAVSLMGVPPARLRMKCPSSEVPLAQRPEADYEDSSGPAYETSTVGDTTIIRIRRFSGDATDLAQLERLPAEYEKHRYARRIVFDVRGNGGGDDATLFKWIFQAAAEPWAQGVSADFRAGIGPCGTWNALVVGQLLSGEVDSPASRAERSAALKTLPTIAASGDVIEVDSGLRKSDATHPYEGSIFVLVDRHTASSGESVPQYLRPALGAHILGERTAGFLDFGNIVPFVLPRTGLWVQVPTTRFFNEGSAEMVGLEVDTYLDAELMRRPAEALLPVIDAIEAGKP